MGLRWCDAENGLPCDVAWIGAHWASIPFGPPETKAAAPRENDCPQVWYTQQVYNSQPISGCQNCSLGGLNGMLAMCGLIQDVQGYAFNPCHSGADPLQGVENNSARRLQYMGLQ